MTAREFLADALMIAHAGFSVFVLYGLLFILAGVFVDWPWTRNRWFRGLNLVGILFLVSRVWLGFPCPFTVAEESLRSGIITPCPLGILTHAIFHQLAYRGNDPQGFARWTTLFGLVALMAHIAAHRSAKKYEESRVASVNTASPVNLNL